jgi:hypothetical protein
MDGKTMEAADAIRRRGYRPRARKDLAPDAIPFVWRDGSEEPLGSVKPTRLQYLYNDVTNHNRTSLYVHVASE